MLPGVAADLVQDFGALGRAHAHEARRVGAQRGLCALCHVAHVTSLHGTGDICYITAPIKNFNFISYEYYDLII